MEMCPVDVICVCSASGEIRPLRLRVEDEKHQMLRIDIEEVIGVKKVPYVGAEAALFLCRVTVGAETRLLELKYVIRTHTWCLLASNDTGS